MDKDKIKEKVIKDGNEIYLSAQDYNVMTDDDKETLRDVLKEEGKDADEYETKMKSLFPKVFTPKDLQWRRR